jgi:NTP pyrophosphatase (non-canonical NTP hydrolase)
MDKDKLQDIFERQEKFMEELKLHDRLPEYPVDMTSKMGQRLIKEMIFNTIEELAEASFTLKNKMHRIADVQVMDAGHYKEELGDALAFFVEICILSGISAKELHEEYVRKNEIVKKRLRNGY